MLEFEVNYLALVVATVVVFVVGMLWYSPMLFGNAWAKLVGMDMKKKKSKEEMMKGMVPGMIFSLIGTFVMGYVLSGFLSSGMEMNQALELAFFIWLGFMGVNTISEVFYQGRKFPLWVIDSGYKLVSILIVAAILVSWQ